MSKLKYTEEQLREAIKNSLSIAEVCRKLNIRPVGGNYKTIKFQLKKWKIDKSHFTGQAWNVGKRYKNFSKKRLLSEILIINSPHRNTNTLRRRLIIEGFKNHECEKCQLKEWNNKPIPLELNHINGINDDNRIENLEIICPNCHAQTNNFRGKNILSALSEKKEVEYRKFKELPDENRDDLEPSLNKEGAETLHGRPKSKCLICEKDIYNSGQKYCSRECNNISKTVKIPTYQELIKSFEEFNSFLQVGKKYNVSDNAVRKWCIRYGILDMVKKKSSAQTGMVVKTIV